MRLGVFTYLFTMLTICNCYELHAQASISKTHRILILLDGSKQMNKQMPDGRTYYETASDIISQLIEKTYAANEDVAFGLRVYGHQYNGNNCNDSRMEVRYTKDNLAQVALRLRDLKPKGDGNPNYAVQQAFANEMTDTLNYWYSLIWISGDTGTCYVNPCRTIDNLPLNNLYKVYNIQLKPSTQKLTNCFEQIFPITNSDDAAQTIATIFPYFSKDKKPEPYWGGFKKKKIPETYKPAPKPKPVATIPVVTIAPKPADTIRTIIVKPVTSIATPKKNPEQGIVINTMPTFTPPKPEQQKSDSVALLTTLSTRSSDFKPYKVARVKAGTIAVPVFNIPIPELVRDTVTLLKTLSTKSQSLSKPELKIIASKVETKAFIPPIPETTRDTVALLTTLPAKSIALKKQQNTVAAARKVETPQFTPPVPEQARDSVAAITSLPAKTEVTQVTATALLKPKKVSVPSYTPAKQPDELTAINTRSKNIAPPAAPKPKVPQTTKVPEFYALPLPKEIPLPTEKRAPEEPVIEETVDPDAIPAIVYGNLNVKTFGATIRVQIYRIKLGEDILVSDNEMNSPRQLKIKLEPGRYKMKFNTSDGTEFTKPFAIDEETDTDINLK
jgi:hypothetical protein